MGDDEREAGVQAERIRNLEEMVKSLAVELGKTQSDLMNVKTELAAVNGRSTLQTVIWTVWPVVVGLIVVIVMMAVFAK